MILTNVNNLPEPLVQAIAFDSYKASGDISVSALISSPRIRILKKLHSKDIEIDAAESIWMLLGTVCHSILERANISDVRKRAFLMTVDTLKEKSEQYTGENKEKLLKLSKDLFSLIEVFFPETSGRYVYELKLHYEYNGMVLSGTLDLFDKIDGILDDYKLCSVFSYMFPESRVKWSRQTNCYGFMLGEAGYEVKTINIICIFRDWSRSKYESSTKDYPAFPFMTIPIEVWTKERARKYIQERMTIHKEAETGTIPLCDGNDKWSSATEYAIIPNGLKRAIRVLSSEAMAKQFILENKHKYEKPLNMFVRPGQNRNCDNYCIVRQFCEQRKRENEELEKLTNQ